jgi:2-iminobutanoate/2-iminopropanoate deaminase
VGRTAPAAPLRDAGRVVGRMVPVVKLTPVDPASAPEATGGYVYAQQVDGATRQLFISGQIPQTRAGDVPTDFEDQCRLVWANVTAALDAAGMGVTNLVKVTTYLSDRAHAATNTSVRREVLGDHKPALTVIITGIWDPAWLIEVDAIAMA